MCVNHFCPLCGNQCFCGAKDPRACILLEDQADLRKQRDDLLAACRNVLARLDLEPADAVFPCSAMRDQLRAAIRAAEVEAQR